MAPSRRAAKRSRASRRLSISSSSAWSGHIRKLRDLRAQLDLAVAHAYGWADLRLDHGFHETKQGVRFTISEAARVDVLDRLLALNHERYAEEVKAGLRGAKKTTKAGRGRTRRRRRG